VQPDDGEDMSLAMKKAADNPDLCFAKALAALQLFREKYTRGAVLPDFINFYEKIREAHT
jgi:glycosyltransferase involved in cell wall biosynthesis